MVPKRRRLDRGLSSWIGCPETKYHASRITHHGPMPRGPGACFNSQIALTPGRTGVISRDGSPDRGLDWVLLKSSGFRASWCYLTNQL